MQTSGKKEFESYHKDGRVVIVTTHYSGLHEGTIACENFTSVDRAEEIARNLTKSINEATGQDFIFASVSDIKLAIKMAVMKNCDGTFSEPSNPKKWNFSGLNGVPDEVLNDIYKIFDK